VIENGGLADLAAVAVNAEPASDPAASSFPGFLNLDNHTINVSGNVSGNVLAMSRNVP